MTALLAQLTVFAETEAIRKSGVRFQRVRDLLVFFVLSALLSSCAHLINISYPPNAVIHPASDQRYTTWDGERVEVTLTPPLRGDAFPYLVKYNQVLLANLIRVRGLRHEYHIDGKGTPLVVCSKNPRISAKAKHYPTDMSLGVTAVKENRPGQVPLLTLYDAVDPVVVRARFGAAPIATNYTAGLAVVFFHARKVATSSASAFLRPDNPRFATGIYLVQPYDPNKIPILFVHGILSSPVSWQNLITTFVPTPQFCNIINRGFFCIRPASRCWRALNN